VSLVRRHTGSKSSPRGSPPSYSWACIPKTTETSAERSRSRPASSRVMWTLPKDPSRWLLCVVSLLSMICACRPRGREFRLVAPSKRSPLKRHGKGNRTTRVIRKIAWQSKPNQTAARRPMPAGARCLGARGFESGCARRAEQLPYLERKNATFAEPSSHSLCGSRS
jgi:hypothetical protein